MNLPEINQASKGYTNTKWRVVTAFSLKIACYRLLSGVLMVKKKKNTCYIMGKRYFCAELNINKMRKLLFTFAFLTLSAVCVSAQSKIQFEKTSYNFGTFSEKNSVQKCTFQFTNAGNSPLVINQAVASCGCTVPSYTKKPIAPGEKGTITVTYDGKGKFPGHFKKTITVRTNGIPEMTRLYVEGTMEEAK